MNKKIIFFAIGLFLLMQPIEPMEFVTKIIKLAAEIKSIMEPATKIKPIKDVEFFKKMLKEFEKNTKISKKTWDSIFTIDIDYSMIFDSEISEIKLLFAEKETLESVIECIDDPKCGIDDYDFAHSINYVIKESSFDRLLTLVDYQHNGEANKNNKLEYLGSRSFWNKEKILLLYAVVANQQNNLKPHDGASKAIKEVVSLINEYDGSCYISAPNFFSIKDIVVKDTWNKKELTHSLLKECLEKGWDKKIYRFRDVLRCVIRLNIEERRYNFMAKCAAINKFFNDSAKKKFLVSSVASYLYDDLTEILRYGGICKKNKKFYQDKNSY